MTGRWATDPTPPSPKESRPTLSCFSVTVSFSIVASLKSISTCTVVLVYTVSSSEAVKPGLLKMTWEAAAPYNKAKCSRKLSFQLAIRSVDVNHCVCCPGLVLSFRNIGWKSGSCRGKGEIVPPSLLTGPRRLDNGYRTIHDSLLGYVSTFKTCLCGFCICGVLYMPLSFNQSLVNHGLETPP